MATSLTSTAPSPPPSVDAASQTTLRYGLLYVPVALAYLFSPDPLLSYAVAWLGSIFIFVGSTRGWIQPLPTDRPVSHQLLRPVFLVQTVFTGFFCVSSIFYVWDLYTTGAAWASVPQDEIALTAAAQRYYLVGHAAFVTGLLAQASYSREGTWQFNLSLSFPQLLLAIAFGAAVLSVGFGQVGFFNQFAVKFRDIAALALVMSFAVSLIRGQGGLLLVTGSMYLFVLVEAVLSGWKHQMIGVVGLLLLYLFPRYKNTTAVFGIVALLIGVTLLPAYNNTFRSLNWDGPLSAEVAAAESVRRIADGEVDVSEHSWSFLKNRTTEIGLFTDYIEHTPDKRPYYGITIVEQALLSIVPRAFWPAKPQTESLVMQRVFENGAVARYSEVSAKPQLVVDGYLSAGLLGVFLTCLLLGLAFSWTSRMCEKYLGGYRVGTAVVYLGLFSTLILTNSFEFFANSFFWSLVTLYLTFTGLKLLGFVYWDATPVPASP